MPVLCLLGRTASTALKAHFLKNQFSKSKIIAFANIHCCSSPLNQNISFKKNVSNCNSEPIVSFLPQKKNISMSSPCLSAHRGHDHGKLWSLERALSVILLPLVPAALFSPSQQLDTALALVMVLHTHFGFEAIVVDYIRPILFGNLVPKMALLLLYLFSIATLAGLLNLIYNDCGLANTILSIWKK